LPAGLSYVEVSAGLYHSLVRRSDGAVLAFGANSAGQCAVPPIPAGLSCVELAAGSEHSVARLSDGSLLAWGSNAYGQCNVAPLPGGTTYVEIAAGGSGSSQGGHTVARRSDRSVVAWGDNTYGQSTVPAPPAGMVCVEIDAGGYCTIARYGFAPAATPIGSGCGGTGAPTLAIGPPHLGQPVFLALGGATPGASGFLVGSPVPLAPLPLGSGCTVQVDIATVAALVPLQTNGSGTWSAGILVPSNPAFAGTQGVLQVVLLGTAGPLGFDLSNGVVIVVGS
jgi:hypothetical protein